MKKNDLKSGMLIESRRGKIGIVMLNTPEGDAIVGNGTKGENQTWKPLSEFTEDLKDKHDSIYDIVRVYGFLNNSEGASLRMDKRPILFNRDAIEAIKLNDESLKYQTISRENLGKLFNEVCLEWKSRIVNILGGDNQFKTHIKVPESIIINAFKEANITQEQMLLEYFTRPEVFTVDMLQIGEIIKVTDTKYSNGDYVGKHILRTYTNWVCLENPNSTWPSFSRNSITGEKLKSGKTLTIIAK